MPLSDGSFLPVAPPWAEGLGAVSIYAKGGDWYSHGTFLCRDAICSNIYLLSQEVIDPREQLGDFLLKTFSDNFFTGNTAFSQPYYSTHPYAHVLRGEAKAFLKEFYTGVTSLSDRETYSFWEHLYRLSPHKLHEESWFLMRCRWMLFVRVPYPEYLKAKHTTAGIYDAEKETVSFKDSDIEFDVIFK